MNSICEHCGLEFAWSKSLARHLRTKHGGGSNGAAAELTFPCTEAACCFTARTQYLLLRHRARKHNALPVKHGTSDECPESNCIFVCNRSDNMQRHLLRVHGIVAGSRRKAATRLGATFALRDDGEEPPESLLADERRRKMRRLLECGFARQRTPLEEAQETALEDAAQQASERLARAECLEAFNKSLVRAFGTSNFTADQLHAMLHVPFESERDPNLLCGAL